MARASTRTLLSLDRFFAIIGAHPLHANQVAVDGIATCDSVVMQYAYQANGRVSREDVAFAIDEAERLLARYLGFDVAPRWNANSFISNSIPAHAVQFKSDKGYFLQGGVEAVSLLQASATVAYSDTDGDGYDETALIANIPCPDVADPDEIAIYYPGKLGASEWEIRPITVTIVSGVATVICRREQLVNPLLQEGLDPEEVDGLDDSNFLTVVDAYRHYNDHTDQGSYIWAQEPYTGRTCGCEENTTCIACGEATQTICLSVSNRRLGYFSATPADWNADTEQFDRSTLARRWRLPDRLNINYRAGLYDGSMIRMASRWERIVAHLALALLPMALCDCVTVTSKYEQYHTDLALQQGTVAASTSYQTGLMTLDSPFGTRVAALEAWNAVKAEALGRTGYHG